MWIGGGLIFLLVMYFLFRDEFDSKALTLMGKEYDTDPESLDSDKVLKRGIRGGEVAELQRRLKGDGAELGDYGPAKDGIDGVFGTTTEKALMSVKGVSSISLNAYGSEAPGALVKPVAPIEEVQTKELT